MKKLLLAAFTAALSLGIGISTAFAQDGPQFRPVELWACTFRDGKDQEDMDDVYEMIEEGTGDAQYAAFQINPYFAGNRNQEFDFIYLGVWNSGSEMGADLANYFASNQEAGEAWDETVDCGSSLYASSRIQAPQQTDDGTFMLAVSDCKLAHGNSNAQAAGAISRFNDYRVANGMEVGTILWYAVAGGGGAEFDFKLVNAFTGPQHWGDYFSWYVDNQAYNVEGPMTEGIVACDESRVYVGRTLMNNMM
jgi:hypothetical protein